MVLLYTSLLLVLGVVGWLATRRANYLERRHAQLTRATDQLIRETPAKEGNSRRPDPYQSAKQAYLLGRLVQKRDTLEAKYDFWQGKADRLHGLIGSLRSWKGRGVPYVLGVLDISFVLVLAEVLGAGDQVNARRAVQVVSAWLGR